MKSHFSPLSSPSSSDDEAVENLLSEILDVTAIEQIQKLPSPISLPPQIHSRFHRLKHSSSLPSPYNNNHPLPCSLPPHKHPPDITQTPRTPESPNPSNPPPKQEGIPPAVVVEPEFELDDDLELADSSTTSGSSSPPHKPGCCLWPSSPRKSSGRKIGNNKESVEDEILSDLSRLSMRRHKEAVKKVLKEQEKLSRETKKVIEWVRQASSKMRVDHFDEELQNCGKRGSK